MLKNVGEEAAFAVSRPKRRRRSAESRQSCFRMLICRQNNVEKESFELQKALEVVAREVLFEISGLCLV